MLRPLHGQNRQTAFDKGPGGESIQSKVWRFSGLSSFDTGKKHFASSSDLNTDMIGVSRTESFWPETSQKKPAQNGIITQKSETNDASKKYRNKIIIHWTNI